MTKNITFFCLKIFFYLYSVDPDEMQYYAAFHLGLHCLQKYSFRGFPKSKGQVTHYGLGLHLCPYLVCVHVFVCV